MAWIHRVQPPPLKNVWEAPKARAAWISAASMASPPSYKLPVSALGEVGGQGGQTFQHRGPALVARGVERCRFSIKMSADGVREWRIGVIHRGKFHGQRLLYMLRAPEASRALCIDKR